jgi:hypothetical protein
LGSPPVSESGQTPHVLDGLRPAMMMARDSDGGTR